jgi:6-pyruvoyltetrahydropterin/6-carboxytetrahydropterin synthase
MSMSITREFGFDMGHCLPDHEGGCYRPHGHRYRLEVHVCGEVTTTEGHPERGMIMDFGRMKQLVHEHVIDVLDHRFAVSVDDPRYDGLFNTFGPDSLVVVDAPPTAEWLAEWIGHTLIEAGLSVEGVRLWETPSCSAVWIAP